MQKKTVLIVDDNESFLGLVSQEIQELGCRVETAGDGEQALRKFAEQKPDFAVLDLVLPDFDGIEILRRLSMEVPGSKIVILTSADDRTKIWAQAAERLRDLIAERPGLQGARMMRKPMDLSKMRELLLQLLSRSEA